MGDGLHLAVALDAAGGTGQRPDASTVEVKGLTLAQIGNLAFTNNVELHELSERRFDAVVEAEGFGACVDDDSIIEQAAVAYLDLLASAPRA